jgi:excisionase family DNA binding protein
MSAGTGTGAPRILLTPEEAAQSLGISRTLVYDLLRSGRLGSVRIGTCRRIPIDALSDFVDSLRLSAPPDNPPRGPQARVRMWDTPYDAVIKQARGGS